MCDTGWVSCLVQLDGHRRGHKEPASINKHNRHLIVICILVLRAWSKKNKI